MSNREKWTASEIRKKAKTGELNKKFAKLLQIILVLIMYLKTDPMCWINLIFL